MLYTDKTSFDPIINNVLLTKKPSHISLGYKRKRGRKGGAFGRNPWGQPAIRRRIRGRGIRTRKKRNRRFSL